MSITTHVCIHGHFYQPPRENPFTGDVPDQPSAAPFPNWNVRITEECYAANTHARIMGAEDETLRELNNYEWMSFDFGPTLLSWLQRNANETYDSILSADRASFRHFGGHGSAMAHSYNHTILPLSDSRDKRTQVLWGIADFRHRFGRKPEGMWLPETAVDYESLRIFAREGIRFTVLAPHQAASVRAPDGEWVDVVNAQVDGRVPYRIDLGEGLSISVFFYNGPLSQEIAFNGVLEDGQLLAKRLIEASGDHADGPVLSHVATDGETYGHHHRFGEMALAAAIAELDARSDVRIVNYAQFLDLAPSVREARVVENSSWSCSHGVERWRSDCGCSTGAYPESSQGWREPLRAALDNLRDALRETFETAGSELMRDPWTARDAYIGVLLGGSIDEFMATHGNGVLETDEARRALGLLEIQHRSMLMYTSCGWFFDDIGRLEAILVLGHAGRAIELAREVLDLDLEPEFLEILERAVSDVDGRTGRDIYLSEVAPHLRG